ncbi:MAG: SOS response-associated peptidase [Clostridiales bacterium]|jgi:putative SOS response-associated peptidase YedK|nr:SOS response-associated peptidase [Clostridiales bacterium]
MCGRYSLFDDQDNAEIRQIIAEVNKRYPDQPIRTGEIFPTNTVPVLTVDGSEIIPKPLVWGFPKYTGSSVIINARAETAEEKNTFRQSLFTGRCIVPSTGFYEWDAQKKKYLFRLPDEQTLYMAGISKEYDGIRRYVILTTAANDSTKDVHHRMPVILPREKLQMWMSDADAAIDYLHGEMPQLVRTG